MHHNNDWDDWDDWDDEVSVVEKEWDSYTSGYTVSYLTVTVGAIAFLPAVLVVAFFIGVIFGFIGFARGLRCASLPALFAG